MEAQDISNPSIIGISGFLQEFYQFYPRPVPLGSNDSIIIAIFALFPMAQSLMRISAVLALENFSTIDGQSPFLLPALIVCYRNHLLK
jgi:hypothetical protein